MTIGELKKEIEKLPDKAEIILLSDSGSLDSVFATWDGESGKHGVLVLDGAYRRGNPIGVTPSLFGFTQEVKKKG